MRSIHDDDIAVENIEPAVTTADPEAHRAPGCDRTPRAFDDAISRFQRPHQGDSAVDRVRARELHAKFGRERTCIRLRLGFGNRQSEGNRQKCGCGAHTYPATRRFFFASSERSCLMRSK